MQEVTMGSKLHKLGAAAFNHPWRIIGMWLVILAILGMLAAQFMKPTSTAISIPGTEAQKALDKMDELFPDAGKGSGRIVFAAPQDKTIEDYKTTIQQTTSELSKIDGVIKVVDPYTNVSALSEDKKIAYTQVQLNKGAGELDPKTVDEIVKIIEDTRTAGGLQVEMGGDIIEKAPEGIVGPGEIGGVLIALVVLVMTLGSLIAAGMPLLTALVGIGVSMAGLFAMSHLFTISSTTPVLAIMLGLAVGIDYSLFIINKYRSYVLAGYNYKDAAGRAIGTAGNAVLFAAATVIIALSALAVVGIPFIATMGLTAAAAIAVAATVSITLIPALLRLGGAMVFPRKNRTEIRKAQEHGPKENHHADRTTFWYRWGAALTRYPLAVVIVCVVAIGAVALPVRDLTLGLPTDEYAAPSTTERKGYDLLTKGFGAGFNGPLLVVAEGLPAVSEADKAAVREPAMTQLNAQIAQATAQQQTAMQAKMATLQTPEQFAAFQQEVALMQTAGEKQKAEAIAKVEGSVEQYAKLVQLKKIADKIAKSDNVKTAVPAMATDDGTAGLIQVIPTTGPSDKTTIDLITYLRDENNHTKLTGNSAIDLSVTGTAALQNDINQKLSGILPLYLAIVIGLSFVLLIIAFRSVLVPLKATLGFLLSVAAMFGALVAIFQWGWFGISEAPGPIVSFIPIIAIGILFGLAMDYEFFLVTSMHEAFRETQDAKRSVLRGFAHASKVVVAAAIIMVSVFMGFVFNHDPTIQAIGFALAFGIFVDAFIVRMTLVPAVMVLLGKSAWWLPGWLDRILPHVSIEGEAETKK